MANNVFYNRSLMAFIEQFSILSCGRIIYYYRHIKEIRRLKENEKVRITFLYRFVFI